MRKLIPLMAERKLLGDLKEECESLRRTKLRLESKGERLEHSERGLLLKIQQASFVISNLI